MKRSVLFGAVFAIALLLSSTPRVNAQAVYGGISGTVTDPQGAAVVGAKVTVTDQAKGTVQEAMTNESGNYNVTHLVPDPYSVRVEAAGFKATESKGIVVGVDATARVDLQVQLGATTESVEVTSEAPQLKTDRADVATTFNSKAIEDLPIYNRNFTTFQLLSPGTQRLNGWNHAASENPQGSQQILTNGQPFSGTGFELDGTDNQDPILGIIVINPNLDSINEVKITSQDYDAEFGKAIGAVVTSQTKSGTNDFHGSIFDYQRSNANNAKDPFVQGPPPKATVPSGNWNQFGGSIGGPIIKNKLFFFGDYQGTRSHVGGSTKDRIATAAERLGDFSAWGTVDHQIFDPCATAAAPNTYIPSCDVPLANRAPFPDNVISPARLALGGGPQAQALLALLPVGANPPAGDITLDNFFGSGNNVLDSDGFDVRSDYSATSKLQVFGRYSLQKFTRSGPGLFGTVLGGSALPSDPSVGNFAGNSNTRNQSLATGFDYTFGTTLLTDFRFGYMRYHVQTAPGGVGTTPATDAGIPGLNLGDLFTSGMPAFRIHDPGADDFNFGYSLDINQCNCPLLESEHQYQFVNNWTKIKGNHSIKFGADIRHAYNLRVPSDSHRAGQLEFNSETTSGPNSTGLGLASFLLGTVGGFNRFISVSTNAYETQPRFFFYGQDTWRITPKLTLNYGLRWEIYRPEEAAGRGEGGWIDLGTGEVRIAGEDGVDLRGNTKTNFKHFAPRLGLAYQITPKTVMRLGYGRSYDMGVFGTIFGHTITQTLPVLAQQSINASADNAIFTLDVGPPPGDPATALDNNCNAITDPTGTNTQCLGVNGRPLLPDGIGGGARRFDNNLPSVDAWNATLQHQITPTLSASIAYVGNIATHTFTDDSPTYGVNDPSVVGYFPGCGLDPNNPLQSNPDPNICPPGSVAQELRRPFYRKYGWTQSPGFFGNDATSHFHSLQITAEKRFSSGLQFQSSYSFQHSNNFDASYYNIDPRVSYGPQPNYRNHVFIFTETYALPFGRGKRWAGGISRGLDFLIGGWSVTSASNFSGGLPFTPSLSSCQNSSDTGPCRPDLVDSVHSGRRSGDPTAGGYWFQTTNGVTLNAAGQTDGPWGQPALDSFGSVGRDSLRGPKFFNTDASVFKDFSITERTKAQFQVQFYNIFNHLNLDLPDSCVDCVDSTTGLNTGGKITNKAYGSQMRALTFALKLNF